MAAATAAPANTTAAAHRPPRQVNVTMTGALTLAWTGDPVRGCAAAGQCGVTGSIQIVPSGSTGSSGGPPPIELSDDSAVARVVTRGPSGAVLSECADLVAVDLQLSIRHTAQGLRAAVPGEFFQPPSAGRCAGPVGSDLNALTLPARRFGAHSYDLSGTVQFDAGPFDVTAQSSLRALVSFGSSVPPPGLRPPGFRVPQPLRPRPALQEHALVRYRIESVQGQLTTLISGLPYPSCAPQGACGDSGRLTQSVSAAGAVSFSASRIVRRRVGAARALADLHRGRLRLSPDLALPPVASSVTETLSGPAGACSDTATGGQLSLQVTVRRRRDGLALTASGPPGLAGDPLRTRCAGPSVSDALPGGSQVLASTPLSPARIGARRLSLTLAASGTFSGLSWSGTRGGAIVLTLVRTRERAGTRRVHIFGGGRGMVLP